MNKILTFFIVMSIVGTVSAGDFAVVVNKSSALSSVSNTDLKRIYTGKMNDIGGKKVVPVNLSLDNPAAASFIPTVVGMSIADYRSFWLAEQVRGGSSAPAVQKSSEAMTKFLMENADAIGYIEPDKVTADLKVLTVK